MSILKTNLIYNVAKRSLSISPSLNAFWNKDWGPAKLPQTKEEKLAAAKKYNLLPQEYDNIPDDGHGAGDYPNFKPYSTESRDPFYPWDFPEYRRNFGEAMHEDSHLYGEDRHDVSMKPRYSLATMLSYSLGVMGMSWLLMYLTDDMVFLPMMPHHLPKDGVKHYTY
ncbi:hypothetical protein O3M35_001765 [Rhynocoris fuscipes]|uniref:NADH dehydrogenase [ubiquinone] 1 beta subcomplex subunit 8, mitochondrial n=1 Tax=Rhynocoris fuscipes TaxID=488301 RepID=A0AAW1CSP3_9HEMI